jgi:hypothetical protein
MTMKSTKVEESCNSIKTFFAIPLGYIIADSTSHN